MDIRILPSELEGFFGDGMIFSIPIFVLFLCGVIFGLFVGFVWEWIREMKHRSASSRKSKELAKHFGTPIKFLAHVNWHWRRQLDWLRWL